jgi:hypothetical protein
VHETVGIEPSNTLRRHRRDIEKILDCRKGIWGTGKLHTTTNIWRMIAQPDASGESNRCAARSRMSYDNSASKRRSGTVARTLSVEEVCG